MKQFFKSAVSFLILVATDILTIILAFVIAMSIRNFLGMFIDIPALTSDNPWVYQINNWWVILIYLTVFLTDGLYSKHRPFWQEARVFAHAIFLTSLFVYSFISLGKIDEFVSRMLFVLHPLILVVLLPVVRRFVKTVLYSLGFWQTKVLELRIDTDYSLKDSMQRSRFVGYTVVKSVPVSLQKQSLSEILAYVTAQQKHAQAETLLVVVKDMTSPEISELVERLYFISSHILIVPELMDLDVLNADVYHMMYENLFVFDINKGLNDPFNRILKRALDIVLALIGAIVLSPLMVLIALKIFLTDGFPILYDHKRYAKGGKIFTFHKFRSMRNEKYVDENQDLAAAYVANDPEKKANWEKYRKLEINDDPRILSGLGIMRKTSMDELAQLFNILKGDMSIVGPRPFMIYEREMIGDYFDRVLAAKPGLTDLWTISGREALSFEQRLKMSTWYIQNWSLWLDFVIIAKTIQQVISYALRWSKKSSK